MTPNTPVRLPSPILTAPCARLRAIHLKQMQRLMTCSSSIILGAILSIVAWGMFWHVANARQTATHAQAQRVAATLARQIEHAVGLGIPLERIQGIAAVFKKRIEAAPDIHALRLTSPYAAKPLVDVRSPHETPERQLEAVSPIAIPGHPDYTVVVRVGWKMDFALLAHATALLIGVWLAGSVLIHEFLRYVMFQARPVSQAHAGYPVVAAPSSRASPSTRRFASVLLATALGAEALWVLRPNAQSFGAIALGALIGAAISRLAVRRPDLLRALAAGVLALISAALALDVPSQWTGTLLGLGAVLILDIGFSVDASADRIDAAPDARQFSIGIFNGLLLIGPAWGGALYLAAPARWAPLWLCAPTLCALLPYGWMHSSRPATRPPMTLRNWPALITASALVGVGLGLLTSLPNVDTPELVHPVSLAWAILLSCVAVWASLHAGCRLAHGMGAMLVASFAALNPWLHPAWIALSLAGESFLFGQGCRAVSRLAHTAGGARHGIWLGTVAASAALTWHGVASLAQLYPSQNHAINIMGVPLLLTAWVIERCLAWHHDGV